MGKNGLQIPCACRLCVWERSYAMLRDIVEWSALYAALNQSIMQLTSTVTYSLIQGNSWNTSGPKHWTSSDFCGFFVTKSGAEHYLFIPHPSQGKVHNHPHISYNTKQSSLSVNVKVHNTGKKCLPLSRLIPVLELTKETSSVRKRPPSDELNQ